MPKDTAANPGLRSGFTVLITAFVTLAISNLLSILLLPYYMDVAKSRGLLEHPWSHEILARVSFLNGLFSIAAILVAVVGATKIRRTQGGLLPLLAVIFLWLGFLGALLRLPSVGQLLFELFRPEDFSPASMLALDNLLNWIYFGAYLFLILGLALLVFSLTWGPSQWLMFGGLAINLLMDAWRSFGERSQNEYPWVRSLVGNGFEVAFFVLFALFLIQLRKESNALAKPGWGEQGAGLSSYYSALRARIVLVMVGFFFGLAAASSGKPATVALAVIPIVVASLVTSWFMLLGIARFAQTSNLAASSILLSCVSIVADISAAVAIISPLLEDSSYGADQSEVFWNNLLVDIGGLVGLLLLLLALRRAAKAVGEVQLAEQGTSIIWLLGLSTLGLLAMGLFTIDRDLQKLEAAKGVIGLVVLVVALAALVKYLSLVKSLAATLSSPEHASMPSANEV